MNSKNHAEVYKIAENLENIYLPKLDAVVNNGDGATIHNAMTLKAKIINEKAIYQMLLAQGETDDLLLSCAVTYREYIHTAELWLTELAKNL